MLAVGIDCQFSSCFNCLCFRRVYGISFWGSFPFVLPTVWMRGCPNIFMCHVVILPLLGIVSTRAKMYNKIELKKDLLLYYKICYPSAWPLPFVSSICFSGLNHIHVWLGSFFGPKMKEFRICWVYGFTIFDNIPTKNFLHSFLGAMCVVHFFQLLFGEALLQTVGT